MTYDDSCSLAFWIPLDSYWLMTPVLGYQYSWTATCDCNVQVNINEEEGWVSVENNGFTLPVEIHKDSLGHDASWVL